MREIHDIVYDWEIGEEGKVDLWLPDTDAFPLFVYFHGGGLKNGSRCGGEANAIVPYLTSHGIGVASAGYRMYPGAKYPDFILDAARAVAFCRENAKAWGASGEIYVGGSSAGGYLSMMLCFAPQYLGKYGIAPTDIDGFIHNAGQPTAHFNVLAERGLDSRRVIVDESAPLYYVGLAEKLPPMLFLWSDNDMAGRPEQCELMLRTLRHFGYDMTKILSKKLIGKHCEHNKKLDADGNNIFAKLIEEAIGTFRA